MGVWLRGIRLFFHIRLARGQNGKAVWFQDSADFLEWLFCHRNVFQNVGCENEIVTRIVKWQLLQVNVVVHVFHAQVRSSYLRTIF